MVKPFDPDLVEEQDEVESESDEEGEEAQIVEVTRQIVLEGKREQKNLLKIKHPLIITRLQ